MKNISKKNKAFTLAEACVTLSVISLILIFTLTIAKSKIKEQTEKFLYYTAFTNLQTAINELKMEGCTDDDVTDGYCDTNGSIPKVGTTGSTTKRGLCDRLSYDIINVTANPSCAATTVYPTTPNFIASNGMKFYDFGKDPVSGIYTVYIDIDGAHRNTTLDIDVMKFIIVPTEGVGGVNGKVYPASDSIAAGSTNYLSASIFYRNASGIKTYITGYTNIAYRPAVCYVGASEALAVIGYCSGYSKLATCNTFECEVEISKPPLSWTR